MAEQVEHWFNSRSGPDRRDVYLIRTESGWQVLGRLGGSDGREVSYRFADEHDARAMVQRMRDATPLGWSNWIEISRPTGGHPSW